MGPQGRIGPKGNKGQMGLTGRQVCIQKVKKQSYTICFREYKVVKVRREIKVNEAREYVDY
jgi:hypothetical protein